jgi:hypothetical protein
VCVAKINNKMDVLGVVPPNKVDDLGEQRAEDSHIAVRGLLKTWRLQFDSDNYKPSITSKTMEALHGVEVGWVHKRPKGA